MLQENKILDFLIFELDLTENNTAQVSIYINDCQDKVFSIIL